MTPFADFVSQYRAHIYYGAYYAVFGDWTAVETLAGAALAYTDVLPPAEEHEVNGEEAAYLLTVAGRHLVRTPADLDRVEESLARFVSRLSNEDSDPRAIVESVAIALMRRFAVLLLSPDWKADTEPPLLDVLINRLKRAKTMLESETDAFFKAIVLKQILSNFVVIGLFDFLSSSGNGQFHKQEVFTTSVAELGSLNETLLKGDRLTQAANSRYIETLLSFGKWVQDQQDPQHTTALLTLLDKAHKDPEMPYDRERYKLMQKLIGS